MQSIVFDQSKLYLLYLLSAVFDVKDSARTRSEKLGRETAMRRPRPASPIGGGRPARDLLVAQNERELGGRDLADQFFVAVAE